MGKIHREPEPLQYAINTFEEDYLSDLVSDAYKWQIITKSVTATLQVQRLSADDAKRIEKAAEQLLKEAELCEDSLQEIEQRWQKQFMENMNLEVEASSFRINTGKRRTMPDEGKIFKIPDEVRKLNDLMAVCVEAIEILIQKVSREICLQKDGFGVYFGWYCFRDAEVDAALERLFTESQRILDEIKEPLEGVSRSLEQCAALLETKEGGQKDE